METFTIGKLARKAGVNVETIRFYERVGLLPLIAKGADGHRHYPVMFAARIRFIKRAKGLGFSLGQIRELLDLRRPAEVSDGDTGDCVSAKIADIEDRIQALRSLQQALGHLAGCEPGSRAKPFSILDFLPHRTPNRGSADLLGH